MSLGLTLVLARVVLGTAFSHNCGDHAGAASESKDIPIPSTISPQWAALYRKLNNMHFATISTAGPDDLAGWARARKAFDVVTGGFEARSAKLAAQHGWKVATGKYGGISVLVVTPKRVVTSKEILIYLHGGAYTFGSARDSLASAGLMADAAGLQVISVNYTLAPVAK